MADFYKQKDVKNLLRRRKILFIGDSTVRPLYKDLLCALTQKPLINPEFLKNPEVASYYGDIVIQQGGRKQDWDFWENRLFERGPWKVEMFFVGLARNESYSVLEAFLSQFRIRYASASTVPDVIYLSFNTSNRKNDIRLIRWFMANLKSALSASTLVIVGSAFPTDRNLFGPVFDEITFFHSMNERVNVVENSDLMNIAQSCQFETLNVFHYLQRNVFKGITALTDWESVVVRFVTCLFLTFTAQALKEKKPHRVTKDVLNKAMTSNYIDADIRHLLLKHAPNWSGIKSHVGRNEKEKAVDKNAEEVLYRLWKTCRKLKSGSKRAKRSQTVVVRDVSLATSNIVITVGTSCSESRPLITNSHVSPSSLGAEERSVSILSQENGVATKAANGIVKVGSSSSQFTGKVQKDVVCVVIQSDEDSLEEGEIRKDLSPLRGDIDEMNRADTLSSASSAEDDQESHTSEASCITQQCLIPSSSTRAPYPTPEMFIHEPLQQGITDANQVGNCAQQIPCVQRSAFSSIFNPIPSATTEPELIVISEEEDGVVEEDALALESHGSAIINLVEDEDLPGSGPEEELLTYEPMESAIINLDDDEDIAGQGTEVTVLPPTRSAYRSTISTPSAKMLQTVEPVLSTDQPLMLKSEGGKMECWPSRYADMGGALLWKWWRSYIEKNHNMLVLKYKGLPEICALNPTTVSPKSSFRPSFPVAKIVDDLCQFLKLIEGIEFPDNFDIRMHIDEENSGGGTVSLQRRVLPLAEELARGSVKKINFEIAHKGNDVRFSSNEAQIGIRGFASLRHFTGQTMQNSSASLRMPSTSSACLNVKPAPIAVTETFTKNRRLWSPLSPWVPTLSNTAGVKERCLPKGALYEPSMSGNSVRKESREHNPSLPVGSCQSQKKCLSPDVRFSSSSVRRQSRNLKRRYKAPSPVYKRHSSSSQHKLPKH